MKSIPAVICRSFLFGSTATCGERERAIDTIGCVPPASPPGQLVGEVAASAQLPAQTRRLLVVIVIELGGIGIQPISDLRNHNTCLTICLSLSFSNSCYRHLYNNTMKTQI